MLVHLAGDILAASGALATTFEGDRADTLHDILTVGTSAGGARAKAVIGWNRATNEVRLGRWLAIRASRSG